MTNQAPATGGRSLRKSVSVGLILGGTFLASILIQKELFILLAAVAVAAGAWEHLANRVNRVGMCLARPRWWAVFCSCLRFTMAGRNGSGSGHLALLAR